jgi:GTPase SAR1 family protein
MRVAIVGEPSVGKSTFVRTLSGKASSDAPIVKDFSRYYPTYGVNYCELYQDDKKLTLLDFGGVEKECKLFADPDHKIDAYIVAYHNDISETEWWLNELKDKNVPKFTLQLRQTTPNKEFLFNLVYPTPTPTRTHPHNNR